MAIEDKTRGSKMSGIIKNEDDFQAHLMKKYESSFGQNLFPKVDRIGAS